MQRVNKNQMNNQQGCMKILLYALPLFSAYIAYSVPASMSFYWIISALLSLVQSIILAKVLGPVQINAKNEARHAALMFENEAKVPYVYAPQEKIAPSNNKNKKKK
jgi:YidC/Oxa1 family membrane protein insertase